MFFPAAVVLGTGAPERSGGHQGMAAHAKRRMIPLLFSGVKQQAGEKNISRQAPDPAAAT